MVGFFPNSVHVAGCHCMGGWKYMVSTLHSSHSTRVTCMKFTTTHAPHSPTRWQARKKREYDQVKRKLSKIEQERARALAANYQVAAFVLVLCVARLLVVSVVGTCMHAFFADKDSFACAGHLVSYLYGGFSRISARCIGQG